MIGFATRIAIGGVFRFLAPLVGTAALAIGLNSCVAKIEAAGAAEYRAEVLTAIGEDNADLAERQKARSEMLIKQSEALRVKWKKEEEVYQSRIAAYRLLTAEEKEKEAFTCPDEDTWRLLRHCPYSQ